MLLLFKNLVYLNLNLIILQCSGFELRDNVLKKQNRKIIQIHCMGNVVRVDQTVVIFSGAANDMKQVN